MENFDFWFDKNKQKLQERILNIVNESISIAKNASNSIKSIKSDGSIVTYADLEVEEYIFSNLSSIDLRIPIISEERSVNLDLFLEDVYWIIDPIDGTSNFSNGKDEYTINIALIKSGTPIFGIIGHPPSETIWFGIKNDSFIYKNNKIKSITSYDIKKKPTIISSRNVDHKTKTIMNIIDYEKITYCSSSLKFCKLVENKAQIYVRANKIKKWDIAAGDAIIRSIGGKVLNFKGVEFCYHSRTEFTDSFFAINSIFYWEKYLQEKVHLKR